MRFVARIQTQPTVWRNIKSQFLSETPADLKHKEAVGVQKALEEFLGKDDEWALFQNYQGVVEPEGLALRASVALASSQLLVVSDVVEALADRDAEGASACSLESSLIRCKMFQSSQSLSGVTNHSEEETNIELSPVMLQELVVMKCKKAS